MRLASAYAQKTREVKTLLDSLPAFAFMKDSDFRYVAVNQVFCEALGQSAQELIAKTDFDLFPEIVAQRFVERDREVLRGRSTLRHEETVDINGRLRTMLVIKAPVLDPNGTPTGLIGVGFDITERKRIEQEHTRLAAALESAGEAVLITDTEGTIQFVNPAFERLTGYSSNEAIGRNPRILKSGYHGAEFYREMWQTLARGQVWQGTIRNRKKDGSLFDADQTLAPVQDREGKTNSYVGVVRDITERKRMVESLQRAVMVKVEFTSMVSHELRTPLTAIKEAIDVVADRTAGPVNRQQTEFLALAKRNVDRLHRLINDTLDFSKLERGDFRLVLGPHDLNALTGEIVMQQRLAAQKQGLRLEISVEEGLPPVRLDPDRVSQVLINLIGNAVRYCDGGWIEVSTRRGEGEDVVVKVQDSGPGIPEDTLEHIFEAFVQLSTGPGRRSGGTGLGLSISKKLVELHGGRIWVESEVGRGAAFNFTLRLHEEPVERSQRVTKSKVLIVDDEEDVVAALQFRLATAGYEVLAASNGAEALEVLKREAVDLVLADFMMPEINGLELTRLVKANPNWFETRIVLFSCNSEPEFRKRALELGALDYLPKTDGANSIVARVYEILSPEAKDPSPLAGRPSSEQNLGESALGEQLRALSRSLEDMLHLAQMDQDIPSTTQYALVSRAE